MSCTLLMLINFHDFFVPGICTILLNSYLFKTMYALKVHGLGWTDAAERYYRLRRNVWWGSTLFIAAFVI